MHFVESLESRRLAVGCDFTGDSICDQADIIAALRTPNALAPASVSADNLQVLPEDVATSQYNVNGDNKISILDIDAIWGAFGVAAGDINLDGNVDSSDYSVFAKQFAEVLPYTAMRHWNTLAQAEGDESLHWLAANDAALAYQIAADSPVDRLLTRVGVDLLNDIRGQDDRHPSVQAFSYLDGDVNNDGHFDSSDFVKLGQDGVASDVDTGEIVRVFQLGTYEQ